MLLSLYHRLGLRSVGVYHSSITVVSGRKNLGDSDGELDRKGSTVWVSNGKLDRRGEGGGSDCFMLLFESPPNEIRPTMPAARKAATPRPSLRRSFGP